MRVGTIPEIERAEAAYEMAAGHFIHIGGEAPPPPMTAVQGRYQDGREGAHLITNRPDAYLRVYDRPYHAGVWGGITRWGKEGEWYKVAEIEVFAPRGGTATLSWTAVDVQVRARALTPSIPPQTVQTVYTLRGKADKTDINLANRQKLVVEIAGRPHGLFGIEVQWHPNTSAK